MQFLKLTNEDGEPCLINLAHVASVFPRPEGGSYLTNYDGAIEVVREPFHSLLSVIAYTEVQ